VQKIGQRKRKDRLLKCRRWARTKLYTLDTLPANGQRTNEHPYYNLQSTNEYLYNFNVIIPSIQKISLLKQRNILVIDITLTYLASLP